MSKHMTSKRQEHIDRLVGAIAEAPMGGGAGMWEAIAAHLYDSGYRQQVARPKPEAQPLPPKAETTGYLATGKAAELLGVTSQTVREYIINGRIKGYRIGPRNYRVPVSEVERILKEAGL